MVSKRRALKALGLSLVAVLALGAAVANAAPLRVAPSWQVKGSVMETGVAKPFSGTNTTEFAFKLSAGYRAYAAAGNCTESGELFGAARGTPGKKTNLSITCNNVKSSVVNCTVNSPGAPAGTVVTKPLRSMLVWLGSTGSAAGDLIEPVSGTTLAELEFGGAACAVNTEGVPMVVKGRLIDEVLPTSGEVTSVNLPATNITSYYNNELSRRQQKITPLKIAGGNATAPGTFGFALSSKEAIGVAGTEQQEILPAGEPHWTVKQAGVTKSLGSTEQRSFTTVAPGSLVMTLGAVTSLEMPECTGTGKIVGSALHQPGKKEGMSLTCKGVTVANPVCKVHSPGQPAGTVATNALAAKLVRTASGVFAEEITASGGSGSAMTTIEFEGASCPLVETTAPITGKLVSMLPLEEIAETVHSSFLMSESKLQWGSAGASLSGSLNSTLTTAGETFGVFPW
jgi:hypothetical protein